jgi:hypothetical protein
MDPLEETRGGPADPRATGRSTDLPRATALPAVAVGVLIVLALTESFDALIAAVAAFTAAHLILRGD